jgi:hypothetical protein
VPLVGEQEHARVDVLVRVQPELHRRHDAEVPAAAAQGPEELGVVVGRRAHELAGRRDELDRGDAVGRQAVLAGEPAQPAAERVAHDAHVRGGAREREQAVRRGRLGDLEPQGAGLDPGDLRGGIDLDAAHLLCREEDRVVERRDRRGVVAGALGRDAEAVAPREGEDRHDVVGGRGQRDVGGPLVDREVPGAAREVPLRLAGRDDLAGEGRHVLGDDLRVQHGDQLPAAPPTGASGESLSLPAPPVPPRAP